MTLGATGPASSTGPAAGTCSAQEPQPAGPCAKGRSAPGRGRRAERRGGTRRGRLGLCQSPRSLEGRAALAGGVSPAAAGAGGARPGLTLAWKWMPCWKASSLCSGTRESQPSSTRLYRFFTGMAAGGRPPQAVAPPDIPAGSARPRGAPGRAARSGDTGTGLPALEPGRVLNERPRVRAGLRPRRGAIGPKFPHVMRGAVEPARSPPVARPARGRSASAAPPGAGARSLPGRCRVTGAAPGGAARGFLERPP